jgi:hypothetical protein
VGSRRSTSPYWASRIPITIYCLAVNFDHSG